VCKTIITACILHRRKIANEPVTVRSVHNSIWIHTHTSIHEGDTSSFQNVHSFVILLTLRRGHKCVVVVNIRTTNADIFVAESSDISCSLRMSSIVTKHGLVIRNDVVNASCIDTDLVVSNCERGVTATENNVII
jgi:hypothetical protein